MDTEALEAAAQRYRDAEAELDVARAALQQEALRALEAGRRGDQAAVSRITGWTREHLRTLKKKAAEERV